MNLAPLNALADRWREEVALLRKRGADVQARALESAVDDFEETLRSWQLEPLTLEEAAEESGYSYSTLQQRVAAGDLPNAGEKGSPRIRRCDLPTRPKWPLHDADEPDLSTRILARR